MTESELFQLPPMHRAQRYRELAEEMQSRAANALSEETRAGYLRMAVQWLDMADEVEARRGTVSISAETSPALASVLRRFSS
jgi:hypothetical protein